MLQLFAVWALLSTSAGCPDAVDTVLLFEPGGSLGSAPFPDERYQGAEGFEAAQTEVMPFLVQLDRAGVQGASATTRIRIPFTPVSSSTDNSHLIKVDLTTAADAIRLYDVSEDAATRVPLAEFRLRPATAAITCRPAAPLLAKGRYAVVVVSGLLKTEGGGVIRPSETYLGIRAAGDEPTTVAFSKVLVADTDVTGRDATDAFFTFTISDRPERVRLLRDVIDGKTAAAHGLESVTVGLTEFDGPGAHIAMKGSVLAGEPTAVAAQFANAGLQALASDQVGRIVAGNLRAPNFLADLDIGREDAVWHYHTIEGADASRQIADDNPPRLSTAVPFRAIPYVLFLPIVDPSAAADSSPIDVVVALHGFGGRKEHWFAMANALNARGIALIAIDAYQHGARQRDVAYPEGSDDARDESVAAAAPETDFPDPFLNPTFLSRTEGKFLQSAADVMSLVRLLGAAQTPEESTVALDWDGDGEPETVGRIMVVGTSLGAMLGTAVASVSPQIERVALYGVGGGISDLSRDSQLLGIPLTMLMLATANAEPFGLLNGLDRVLLIDRPEREVYGVVVDSILASVDPANLAQSLVDGSQRGDGGAAVLLQVTEDDRLVPNNATDRVVRSMMAGLPEGAVGVVDTTDRPALFPLSAATTDDVTGLRVQIRQHSGAHGVLLDWVDVAATAAAQDEAATFLAAP